MRTAPRGPSSTIVAAALPHRDTGCAVGAGSPAMGELSAKGIHRA